MLNNLVMSTGFQAYTCLALIVGSIVFIRAIKNEFCEAVKIMEFSNSTTKILARRYIFIYLVCVTFSLVFIPSSETEFWLVNHILFKHLFCANVIYLLVLITNPVLLFLGLQVTFVETLVDKKTKKLQQKIERQT